jgi:ATP-dependent helicase HrpB
VVEHVCRGAYGLKDIKDRPVLPVVKAWLSGAQRALVEQYAPERLALPGGRRVRVTYAPSGPPTVAARIQDLYGVKGGLTVARGRQPVTIQVLAPNNRPVQITSDLGTFWKDGYPRVKQELQRKYPRHEWR